MEQLLLVSAQLAGVICLLALSLTVAAIPVALLVCWWRGDE
jgi:hypothetical protein